MLRNLAWDKTDELTRAQLAMFHALGDEIRLSEDDRRRALDLDDGTWAEWQAFLADGRDGFPSVGGGRGAQLRRVPIRGGGRRVSVSPVLRSGRR